MRAMSTMFGEIARMSRSGLTGAGSYNLFCSVRISMRLYDS